MIFDSLKLCRWLSLVLSLVFSAGVSAQVLLSPDRGIAHVLGHVHASTPGVIMPSESAAFEAWDRGEFDRLDSHLAKGYVNEPVWLAFDVQRQDHLVSPNWILEVGPSALDRVEVWIRTPQGTRYLGRAGDQREAFKAPVLAFKPTFLLDFGDELQATVLVRIQTSSTLVGLVRLMSAKSYPSEQAQEGGLMGFIFTVSGLLLFLAFSRALVTRDPAFVLWGVYILVTALLWATLDGLAYRFFAWSDPEHINLLTSVLTLLSWGTMAAFVTTMFEFRLIRPWLPKVVWGSFAVFALLGLPGIVWGGVSIDQVVAIGLVLYLPYVVFGLLYQIALGRNMSVWHGPWFMVYLVFVVWHVLATRGVLPYGYGNFYGWQVAGVTSLMSMHWAMIQQARSALKARDQERLRLLAEISSKNQELEDRVVERTRSLAKALNDMEQAEAEQRQLLSMASHEFRTPAAMIKASLESLSLLQAQTPPAVQQRLNNMALASDRMLLLANGLIQQDRLRENSLRPQMASLDLCKLVHAVAAHYPASAAIDWNCPSTAMKVNADATLLSIALYNLVDNALRYHPDQARSPVRVCLGTRRGDQGLPGDWAVIRVSDEGPGVSDADKARLFERFESSQTRPDRAPSGLGLSIVARVAQVHGGRVSVSDNSPVGTVFELVLPLAAA
jgi:signal transduction histidine kinase